MNNDSRADSLHLWRRCPTYPRHVVVDAVDLNTNPNTYERTNERTNEWMNEWMNEWKIIQDQKRLSSEHYFRHCSKFGYCIHLLFRFHPTPHHSQLRVLLIRERPRKKVNINLFNFHMSHTLNQFHIKRSLCLFRIPFRVSVLHLISRPCRLYLNFFLVIVSLHSCCLNGLRVVFNSWLGGWVRTVRYSAPETKSYHEYAMHLWPWRVPLSTSARDVASLFFGSRILLYQSNNRCKCP